MKISRSILLFLCFALFSCENDPVDYGLGEYFQDIVTAAENRIFLLDNGKQVYEQQTGDTANVYQAGKRVVLIYSYTDSNVSENLRPVHIHQSYAIPLGELKTTTTMNIGRLPEIPIQLQSVWMGSHYLNFRFYMEYKSETHSMMLVCDEKKSGNAEQTLYLKHDTNKDPAGYWVFTLMSIDLSRVLGEPTGERTLHVHLQTTNYGEKTYTFKY
ncbi:MAG: hypothetical protein LBN18_03345 [Dysgonamonadaceae bacterium]|jgi:hypothetical protein|nr:hypothetical protein [Dysgonamonadaceae bacterium]